MFTCAALWTCHSYHVAQDVALNADRSNGAPMRSAQCRAFQAHDTFKPNSREARWSQKRCARRGLYQKQRQACCTSVFPMMMHDTLQRAMRASPPPTAEQRVIFRPALYPRTGMCTAAPMSTPRASLVFYNHLLMTLPLVTTSNSAGATSIRQSRPHLHFKKLVLLNFAANSSHGEAFA